jgi:hypothetical protein
MGEVWAKVMRCGCGGTFLWEELARRNAQRMSGSAIVVLLLPLMPGMAISTMDKVKRRRKVSTGRCSAEIRDCPEISDGSDDRMQSETPASMQYPL